MASFRRVRQGYDYGEDVASQRGSFHTRATQEEGEEEEEEGGGDDDDDEDGLQGAAGDELMLVGVDLNSPRKSARAPLHPDTRHNRRDEEDSMDSRDDTAASLSRRHSHRSNRRYNRKC